MAGPFSARLEDGIYTYALFVANLAAFVGLAWVTVKMALSLGLYQLESRGLSELAYVETKTIITFGFCFLASVISLAASWKMLRSGVTSGSLIIVIILQVCAVAVFHSWASILPAIPAIIAIYGLVVARAETGETGLQTIRGVAQGERTSAHRSHRESYPQRRPTYEDSSGPNDWDAATESTSATESGSAGSIICPHCNEQNPEDALFCGGCGARF